MTKPKMKLRHVFAVFVGNGLEFYNFLTFVFFAVYIGRAFFPSVNHDIEVLASLATGWVGFVMRPVGAIVIGRMGDRIGRKPAMILSFALMGAGMIGIALTPSYARIGIAAPVLVVLFRLIQGFALGGEVGPTTAFMAEAAPPGRRGLYLSAQYATQDCATLAAGIVGVILASHLNAQQLQDWGWRVALGIGAVIIPFGFALRRSLPETLHKVDDAALAPDATTGSLAGRGARPYLPIIVFGLMMLTAGTIGSYTTNYMTTYALDTLHLAATVSFGLTVVNGALSVPLEIFSGWASDKFGRKPVMIVPGALLLVAILPCFWVIDHFRNVWALYGAQAVMVSLAAVSSVPTIVAITEQLPPRIRSGAVAMIYAFAISIFGGSTQFVIKGLLVWTHNPLAPAYYWTAAAVVGLIAMVLVAESAPVKTERR